MNQKARKTRRVSLITLINSALSHSKRSNSSSTILLKKALSRTNQPKLITIWHRMQLQHSYRKVYLRKRLSALSRKKRQKRRKRVASIAKVIEMDCDAKANEVNGRKVAIV